MIVALLLVTVSLALFAYPNISKDVVQKKNDEIIEHFCTDHVTDHVLIMFAIIH